MFNEWFGKWENLLAGVLACTAAVCVLVWRPAEEGYCLEARQRAAVARDLTGQGAADGVGEERGDQDRGNQGLVGSLFLAPLPTALVAFMGLLPGVGISPFLCCVISAASAAMLGLYVHHLWRRHGVSVALRIPVILGVQLLPPVVKSIWVGQTSVMFLALVVCGIGALVEWLRASSLRDLAVAALLLAMAVGTRHQGVLFAAGALVFVAGAALLRRRGWSYFEGTILTVCVPIGYVILLWIAGNWLILGQPFFFLRAATGAFALGLMGLRDIVAWDCPWMLVGIVGALAFAVPVAACLARAPGGGVLRHAAAAGALVACCWVMLEVEAERPIILDPTGIRATVATLRARYENTVFVVSGYGGYAFMDEAPQEPARRWVHAIRLDPAAVEKIGADFRGWQILLLVNAVEATDQWEDVRLDWLRQDSRIPESVIVKDQIGPWTLFEVVSP